MCDEYKALIDNKTWVLVPRPPNVNIVRSMWLYKHKYNADGSLSRYKAQLVTNGRSQQQGIDCDETFSPAVKPTTIRTVLSLAVSRQWPIHRLDVKNAFLHEHLTETVYMHQPSGFTDSAHSDYVCLLQKSLYGLKQAPQAWFQRFFSYVIRAGFYHSKTDSSLFIFHKGPDTAYLLLYVDDIILTASSTSLMQRIISSLHAKFARTDLGPLNYFLGISATRTTSGIFSSQTKYATEILERAHMLNCNPCRTPVDTEKKLGPEGSPVTDPTLYRRLAGALQYLTFTRPDLSYAVQQLCLYMHDPREPHLNAMKRVLRYLRGTTDLGLQLFRSTTSQLIAYSDADWAGVRLRAGLLLDTVFFLELRRFSTLQAALAPAASNALEKFLEESKKTEGERMGPTLSPGIHNTSFADHKNPPSDLGISGAERGNPSDPLGDRYAEPYYRRLGSYVSSYISMVSNTLRSTIPKAIVYCQVKESKQNLPNYFYTQIGRREGKQLAELLHEDPSLMSKRQEIAKSLELYKAARAEIDFATWVRY
nr:ribonuclease H-like domain-containing protein [Tanacetum cinerariifolium]